jgi:hypothetical protein
MWMMRWQPPPPGNLDFTAAARSRGDLPGRPYGPFLCAFHVSAAAILISAFFAPWRFIGKIYDNQKHLCARKALDFAAEAVWQRD